MSRRTRLLFPVTVLLTFFLGFEAGGFQLVLARIADEFSLGGAAMGFLAAVQYVAIIVMPLLFGSLSDRVGKKKVLVLFMGVFILGCAIVVSAGTATVFVVGIFVLGSGYCICEATSSAALADTYGDGAQKRLNLVQCGFSLGAVSGPLLAERLMVGFGLGWRVVFICSGIAYLLIMPFLLNVEILDPAACPYEQKKVKAGGRLLALTFSCLFGGIVIYTSLENGVAYFLDSFLGKALDASEVSALSISLFWLSMACSRLLAGVLNLPCHKLLPALFGSSAILLLLMSAMTATAPAMLICCLLGLLFGPVWPTLIALAASENPGHSGRATSIMTAGCGLGGALSPAVLGYVMEAGGVRSVFVVLALAAAFGVAAMLIRKRRIASSSAASAAGKAGADNARRSALSTRVRQ